MTFHLRRFSASGFSTTFPNSSGESDRTNNRLFFAAGVFFSGFIIPSTSSFHSSLHPSSPAPPPSLWESVMGVWMVPVQMWEPSLESRCSAGRLHYPPGILESLSSCRLLSSPRPPPLPFFLAPPPGRAPLAIQRREALRN